MKISTSKIFMLLLCSVFLLSAVKTIIACGYSDEEEGTVSLFAPEIIAQPDKAPFFLSPHVYYSLENFGTPETFPTLTDRNTDEWDSFFENKISRQDVEWLIYGSSTIDLETLQKSLTSKKIKTDTLNQAVVKMFRKQKKGNEILDYLILAKSSEKYFNPPYDSWQPSVYDSVTIQRNTEIFKDRFVRATLPFLKQRYGFQVTRGLSVGGRHADCIRFYDEEFNPTVTAASMFYRSLGYKARSLYRLQQYSLSNYFYAYLYGADPCQRYMAYQSFHPQYEADWTATLALAKTTTEKEALWELCGLYADPIRAIKELYAINPQSNSLPLLLVRVINITEQQTILNPERDYSNFYYADYAADRIVEWDSASQQSLDDVMEKAIEEKKTNKPGAWQLSAAYFALLKGDYRASAAILSGLSPDEKDSLLLGQAAIIKGVLAVKTLQAVNTLAENKIFDHIQKISSYSHPALRKENALRYINSQLSLLYAKQNDLLKKELAYPQGQSFYHSSDRTQDMISFMNRNDHDSLENYFIRKYPLNPDQLHDIKAAAYLYEYNFTAAAQEFEREKATEERTLDANPFNIHINDCHECDAAAQKAPVYSYYSFAKKMADLKANGDKGKDAESRAQNYFRLANGMYNMTWYGNSHEVHGTAATRDDYGSVVYGKNPELKASNFFKCKEALAYYQKAAALTKNREFRAKCKFMSAKCEHNLWLDDRKEEDRRDFIAGTYFQQLKNNYSNTQYYKEVINECGYFCTYITGKDSCKRYR